MHPSTVVRPEPPAGPRVAAGEAVKLVVVRPIPDPFRPVPNLAGLEVAEARARLQEVGLTAVVPSNRAEGTSPTRTRCPAPCCGCSAPCGCMWGEPPRPGGPDNA